MELKKVLITMFANELSFSNLFVNHSKTMFQDVNIIAHNSFDGTFEKMQSAFGEKVKRSSLPGHPQSTLMTQLMNEAFEDGADVVFPLDFDEFLPFESGVELDSFLRKYQNCDVLEIPWRNFGVESYPLKPGLENLIYYHDFSKVKKSVIFRSAWKKNSEITLVQGNHSLKELSGMKVFQADESYIIHIPVRDPLHFAQKNILGATAFLNEFKHALSDDWVRGALKPFPGEDSLIQQSLDYGATVCVNGHFDLKSETKFGWMTDGFSLQGQLNSFLSFMQEKWPEVREIYREPGSAGISAIELAIKLDRLRKYEESNLLRGFLVVERILKTNFFSRKHEYND